MSSQNNKCDLSRVLAAPLTNIEPLPYNNQVGYLDSSTGKVYGCGFELGCFYSNLKIEKAYFNANESEIELKGNYYFDYLPGEQQPFSFTIFLATPKGRIIGYDTLQNVRVLATIEIEIMGYNKDSVKIYSPGQFHVKFKFQENDRLYFDAGQHMYLTEYNVGCLLAGSARHKGYR